MAMLADSHAAHIEANNLLPDKQRALRARGCMDCWSIDLMVIADAQFKAHRTLGVGWIDFEEAYDMQGSNVWGTSRSVMDTIHAPR